MKKREENDMPEHPKPEQYEDMLYLPHHTSETRPRMPLIKRAAQFAPFAALCGYEDAISETARLTKEKPLLSEDALATLDETLQELSKKLPDAPAVTITYYVPDTKKEGGSLPTLSGTIRRIDLEQRTIQMEDLSEIPLDDIIDITWASFQ